MAKILTNQAFSITEIKRDLPNILKKTENQPFAVLNRNKPVFYCVPPEMYAYMLECLENTNDDKFLNQLADMRKDQKSIPINIDDL